MSHTNPITTLPRPARILAIAAVLAAVGAAPAFAQGSSAASSNETTSLEVFATHYWLDDAGSGSRPEIGGGGARVLFNLGSAARSTSAWFTRSSLGAFAVYTPKQKDDDVTTLHYGGELDAQLLPHPLLGFLDPFLSVGAGAFRTQAEVPLLLGGTEKVTNTDFALAPGAGTYFHFTPNIAVRGDVRDVVIFGDKTTHNYEASAGLSLNF